MILLIAARHGVATGCAAVMRIYVIREPREKCAPTTEKSGPTPFNSFVSWSPLLSLLPPTPHQAGRGVTTATGSSQPPGSSGSRSPTCLGDLAVGGPRAVAVIRLVHAGERFGLAGGHSGRSTFLGLAAAATQSHDMTSTEVAEAELAKFCRIHHHAAALLASCSGRPSPAISPQLLMRHFARACGRYINSRTCGNSSLGRSLHSCSRRLTRGVERKRTQSHMGHPKVVRTLSPGYPSVIEPGSSA